MRTFADVWKNLNSEQKQQLADGAGTSKSYLSQIAHGHRGPSRDLIGKLVRLDYRITGQMFL